MPGPIVHLVVQQRLPMMLRELGGDRGRELAETLRADPCSPYAAFGSMGPDFLFFSVKEYGSALADLVNGIFAVYDAMEPIIDFYEENIKPIADAIDDITTAIDQALFQGLFSDLQAVAGTMKDALLLAAGNFLSSHIDPFYFFFPKLQSGAPETDWYWFDFLHYRRTGQFCSEMWRIANTQNDDDLRRYVLGYASHIGTDVVGHPFVNAVVGGPYRMHWRRHKLVENWIDAYARNHYGELAGIKSCLQLTSDENALYSDRAISGSYWWKLVAFPDEKMPDKLSQMFVDAMNSVYSGIDHPPFFNTADVDSTYRLWLMWFKRATSVGSARKPVPVPPPGSATAALVSDYIDGFPPFPGGGGSGGSSFSLSAIFEAIWNFLKWLGEVIAHTLEWIVTNIVNIVLLPITEAIGLLKWLVYQLHKLIYTLYDEMRFGLVLAGLLFPEPEDLTRPMVGTTLWAPAFINTAAAHTTLGGVPNFGFYPLRRNNQRSATELLEIHLRYPQTPRERRHAERMPRVFEGANPEQFIDGGFAFDPVIEALYVATEPYDTPKATHTIDQATWNTPQFGSALHFCSRLIAGHIDRMPNFNLDGDRGYGWKTWRALKPNLIEGPIVGGVRDDLLNPSNYQTDVEYIDA